MDVILACLDLPVNELLESEARKLKALLVEFGDVFALNEKELASQLGITLTLAITVLSDNNPTEPQKESSRNGGRHEMSGNYSTILQSIGKPHSPCSKEG